LKLTINFGLENQIVLST